MQQNNEFTKAALKYSNTNHPNYNISQENIKQIMEKIDTSSADHNRKYKILCPVRNKEVQVAVWGHAQMDKLSDK